MSQDTALLLILGFGIAAVIPWLIIAVRRDLKKMHAPDRERTERNHRQ